jgi:hypothetical protein
MYCRGWAGSESELPPSRSLDPYVQADHRSFPLESGEHTWFALEQYHLFLAQRPAENRKLVE